MINKMTNQKEQYPSVEEGRTKIKIQEGLTFISPAKGPDTYQNTLKQIL